MSRAATGLAHRPHTMVVVQVNDDATCRRTWTPTPVAGRRPRRPAGGAYSVGVFGVDAIACSAPSCYVCRSGRAAHRVATHRQILF